MNKYMVYTAEGVSLAPDGSDIEDCQILGRIEAKDKNDAIEKLWNQKQWLHGRGFDPSEWMVAQLHDTEWVP